jgi:two-component system, OmpR family, response regulator VicR
MKILVVDDDRDLVELIRFALQRAGFEAVTAYDSPTALAMVDHEAPDLAVVDLNLGSWDGFELIRDLRRKTDLPTIVLTGRTSEEDTVRGLELGADDYMTKPFSHRELIARIRANLRRHGQVWTPPEPAHSVLRAGPLEVNTAAHQATYEGEPLDLTVTEYRLLHYLLLNQGVAVPTRAILKQVWGYEDATGGDVVRVAVHRLRRKLGESTTSTRLLHTIPGVGFMVKPTED